MFPNDILYNTARSLLGINLAVGNEWLGCAQSFSAVNNRAFPGKKIHFLGTSQCYDWMKNSPKWLELKNPEPKCTIVSVTSMIPQGSFLEHGHIGILGQFLADDNSYYIMSNDSYRGYWNTQFTLKRWENYYIKYGRIPTFYFKRIMV